ncbi:hypothetical protein, conserved [Trypanosoma brucei gambiense DAL972]|uniref:Uncharacterized protein n=2 Tax=Trypanosoma brucei TaxID=5691 RepID=C9ZTW5_TRYB9|nr:hypothetical protein, conserved [Trypanosoma brucei gambiense DAL972]RHW71613.1 hypothetical protein DPX39_070073600 [Trypanosoma brucei equiperdum]CBH12851.1 hypothetical protein, conserved [Trypanosoma brucei gambiense DAL972]|eukprot:XP_011775130.1 hypothetical protein, conserved [Trypanosoma brucei gambiense DAL972]
MFHSKTALSCGVREFLESQGVRNARVSIELFPDIRGVNGSRNTTASSIAVSVSGDEHLPVLDQQQLSPSFTCATTTDACRDGKAVQKTAAAASLCLSSTTAHSSPGSRHTSVVLVEEQKTTEQPVRYTPAAATPVFSILSTDVGDVTDRHGASAQGVSNVHVVDVVEVEEPRYQPIFGDAGMEANPPSILISSSTGLPCRNSTGQNINNSKADSLKLPSLAEKGDTVTNSNNNSSDKLTHEENTSGECFSRGKDLNSNGNTKRKELRPPKVYSGRVAPCEEDSKKRLQDLLREQEAMERESLEGLSQHDKIVKEAEKYLEELRQVWHGSKSSNGEQPPRQHLSAPNARPQSSSRGPKNPSTAVVNLNEIKVVKFTLPTSAKAKEEVLVQLRASAKGAQHLTNKDKFSLLLREQQAMLHDNASTEEEYQKLLQQAVSYHERTN